MNAETEELVATILDFHQLSDSRRARMEAYVHRVINEEGALTPNELYALFISSLERFDLPPQERFALRFDDPDSYYGARRDDYAFIRPFDIELDADDLVTLAQLPRDYVEFLEEAEYLLDGVDLTTMVQEDLASVDTVAARIAKLRQRKEEFLYVVPPLRPLKRVGFDDTNNLVVQMGRYPKYLDVEAYYHQYYGGVTRHRLAQINSAISGRLKNRGKIGIVPKMPRDEVVALRARESRIGFERWYVERYGRQILQRK
jgi:hypothetical protein